MAAKRSIPTTLFESPDFFELSSDTIRLILIGIILDADDEGRGSAHPRLLARKLDKQPADIEQALAELEAHGILRCYTVEMRSYYTLCHWDKYQVLSRPTPSLYPLPPDEPEAAGSQGNPGNARNPQGNPGAPLSEGEGEKEREEKKETEEENAPPARVTRFPGPHLSQPSTTAPGSSDQCSFLRANELEKLTKQVASLLKLEMTTDLRAIVQEFSPLSTISLVGEAIEACAWIEDQRRNRKQQQMTPAFFRRWLKRERGDYGLPQGNHFPVPSEPKATRPGERSLLVQSPASSRTLADPYQAYIQQRVAEIQATVERKAVGI